MYIKQHNFTYPEMVNNTLKLENITLRNPDEVIVEGILLIIRIGNSYNFYLPSLGDDNQFNKNVFCIFNNIKEYIFKDGLLFIKEGNSKKGNWVILEPNMFSCYLTRINLPRRKESLLRIPYSGETYVEILELPNSNGVFVDIGKEYYWIENRVSSLELTKIYGSIRSCKIYNTFILSYKNQEKFFENGNLSQPYPCIKEFNYQYDNFAAYLCFSDYTSNCIKSLKVGLTVPTSSNEKYLYTVEFEKPLRNIKFITRNVLKASQDINIPDFAIDIWKITYLSGKEMILLQGIGECQFTSIISKELSSFLIKTSNLALQLLNTICPSKIILTELSFKYLSVCSCIVL